MREKKRERDGARDEWRQRGRERESRVGTKKEAEAARGVILQLQKELTNLGYLLPLYY